MWTADDGDRAGDDVGRDGAGAAAQGEPARAGADHGAEQLPDDHLAADGLGAELEEQNPDVKIAVLLPELVVRHWWEYFLHNQRVQL